MTESGGVAFKGGASFETTATALSELNGKFYMFTYDSDSEGNAEWILYPCIQYERLLWASVLRR